MNQYIADTYGAYKRLLPEEQAEYEVRVHAALEEALANESQIRSAYSRFRDAQRDLQTVVSGNSLSF